MTDEEEEIKKLLNELRELRKRLDEIEKRVRVLEEKKIEVPKEKLIHVPEEKPITRELEEKAEEVKKEELKPIIQEETTPLPQVKEETKPAEPKSVEKPEPLIIEEPSFPEKPPKEIEFTLGSSVFQRIGLLFILVAFISAGYWIYSEIVFGSSQYKLMLIYTFIAMVYFGGFSLILVGAKIHKSPAFPSWYSESLLATGIAVLMAGALIARYWFSLIKDLELMIILAGFISINFLLAKKLESKGLVLEGILNIVFVGFVIAWFIPNYPIAQIYMMTLFILLFVRLPENIKENAKIMTSFYAKFIVLAFLQRYAIIVRGMEPNWLIQLLSVLSISLLYGSFELQRINYSLNSLLSALSIVVIALIMQCNIEPVLAAVIANFVIGIIIHLIKMPEADIKLIIVDELTGLFYAFYLMIYGLYGYVSYNTPLGNAIAMLNTYPAIIILLLANLKVGLSFKTLPADKIMMQRKLREASVSIPIFNFIVLLIYSILTLNPLGIILLPFIPLTLVIINELTGMRGWFNYLFASILFGVIIGLKNIDYWVVIISSISYLLLILINKQIKLKIDMSLNLIFLNSISLEAILKLFYMNVLQLGYIVLYSYLVLNVLWIYSSRSMLENTINKVSIGVLLLYIDQLILAFSPFLSETIHFLSIASMYLMLNIAEYKSRYSHNLALLILAVTPYFTNIISNTQLLPMDIVAMTLTYIALLSVRSILVVYDREIFDKFDFYLTIFSGVLVLNLITYQPLILSISLVVAFLTTNLFIGERKNLMFHQAISTYAFIGVTASFYFEASSLLNQLDIASILYLVTFSIYGALSIVRKDFELIKANFLAYPLLIYLFYAGHIVNWGYIYIYALALMSFNIYHIKDKLIFDKPWYWKMFSSIFWLINFIGAVTSILAYQLAIFAIYVADYLLLSRIKLLDRDIASILNVANNATLLILCIPHGSLLVPEIQLLAAIYAYAIINYLVDWIPHSKYLTNMFFPIQLAIGFFFLFNNIHQIIIYLVYATLGFIAISAALWRTGLIPAISVSTALVIVSFIEADVYLVSFLLVVLIASFTYLGMNTEPVIVLLALPPIISFTYNQNLNPLISASIGVIFLVITEIRRSLRTEAKAYFILHPVLTYLISLSIIIVSFYVVQMDLFITILLFGLGSMIISWIIDLLRDVEELSYYTLLGSITASLVIASRYLLSVETTIYVAIIGIFTLLAGIINDRLPVRLIGLAAMLAIAFKGVADIVWLIEQTALSQFLKIALISLFLGGVFLGISFIYIKLYRFREEIKTRILGTKNNKNN